MKDSERQFGGKWAYTRILSHLIRFVPKWWGYPAVTNDDQQALSQGIFQVQWPLLPRQVKQQSRQLTQNGAGVETTNVRIGGSGPETWLFWVWPQRLSHLALFLHFIHFPLGLPPCCKFGAMASNHEEPIILQLCFFNCIWGQSLLGETTCGLGLLDQM